MKILIVVDVQKDFVDGALGSVAAAETMPAIYERVARARREGDLIIFTQDTHKENYLETEEGKKLPVKHCIKGTEGWQIMPNLVQGADFVLSKDTFGATGLTKMLELIENKEIERITDIELIGFCTDICVVSNALILKPWATSKGIRVSVDSSCCAGTSEAAHEAALTVMRNCQIDEKMSR